MNWTARLVLTAIMLLFAASPILAQEEENRLLLGIFAGTQPKPTRIEAFRPVEYQSGFHVGGVIGLGLYRHLGVRAEVAVAGNSGREGGGLDQEVDYRRIYYGTHVEIRYPLSESLTPYFMIGGGAVALRRRADSYNYSVTEGAGIVGLGLSFQLSQRLTILAQGNTWIYTRHALGDAQYDTLFSVGLGYPIQF